MQKWEYKVIKVSTEYGFFSGTDFDEESFQKELNQLGNQGWELICLEDINKLKGGSKFILATFKRPLG
jgi:hypothetical protein